MTPRTVFLGLALLAMTPWVLAADYTQAPGSTLGFSGEYQGERYAGRFPGFATRLSFDPARPAKARLDVVIPMTSATLGISDYDVELRGPAFFHSSRFGQARYRARGFRALGGDRYAADGTLNLRGVAHPVTLEFTWTAGERPILEGGATVRRLQFGVGAGEWADTDLLPDAIAVTTRVVLQPAR
jgi:polyisoprenoid-binding protein YceI